MNQENNTVKLWERWIYCSSATKRSSHLGFCTFPRHPALVSSHLDYCNVFWFKIHLDGHQRLYLYGKVHIILFLAKFDSASLGTTKRKFDRWINSFSSYHTSFPFFFFPSIGNVLFFSPSLTLEEKISKKQSKSLKTSVIYYYHILPIEAWI